MFDQNLNLQHDAYGPGESQQGPHVYWPKVPSPTRKDKSQDEFMYLRNPIVREFLNKKRELLEGLRVGSGPPH